MMAAFCAAKQFSSSRHATSRLLLLPSNCSPPSIPARLGTSSSSSSSFFKQHPATCRRSSVLATHSRISTRQSQHAGGQRLEESRRSHFYYSPPEGVQRRGLPSDRHRAARDSARLAAHLTPKPTCFTAKDGARRRSTLLFITKPMPSVHSRWSPRLYSSDAANHRAQKEVGLKGEADASDSSSAGGRSGPGGNSDDNSQASTNHKRGSLCDGHTRVVEETPQSVANPPAASSSTATTTTQTSRTPARALDSSGGGSGSGSVRDQARSSIPSLPQPQQQQRYENIYNLPNALTVTRLLAAPATAYLLLHDHHTWALALFAYAGITDLVDGWLARRWKLQTVAGSVIDPMADKALMIIVTVTLAVKAAIPLYLATLILGRDASLAVAAIYYRYASLPPPKTSVRYWDFSLPSAEVHPTTVSKYNTFLQLLLIGFTLALPVVTVAAAGAADPSAQHSLTLLPSLGLDAAHLHVALHYLQYVVAATTAWSGLSYAFLKDAVTILGSNEALKARQGARGRAIIGVTFGSIVLAAAWFAVNVDEEVVVAVDDDNDGRRDDK